MTLLDLSSSEEGHIAERLRTATMAWIVSVRPDGRPHSVPVWFVWDDPSVVVFTQGTSQKVRNLRANPACRISVETEDLGQDVVFLDGTAEVVDPGEADRLGDASGFAAKYAPMMGEGGFHEWVKGFPQPLVVRATRIVAWSKPGGEFRFRTVGTG